MSKSSTVHQVLHISGGYETLDPGQFANRATECELVRKRVESAQKGKIDQPLVELYGVVGQGKSWLLSFLVYQYWFSNGSTAHTGKPTFSAKVDLGATSAVDQNYRVLQSLADQIDAQLARPGTGWALSPQLRDQLAQPEQANAAAQALADLIVTSTEHYVPVLAFDATEQAEEELLDWIEERLVYPILRETSQAVLLFGGRFWRRWKRFEVRRRVQPVELFPFDHQQSDVLGTTELLDKLGVQQSQDVAGALYQHAFGHPLTSKIIVNSLLEETPAVGIGVQTVLDNQFKIAELIRTQVVENRFFDELNSDPDLRRLLWAICILRKFNPTPLRHFTVRFIGDEYEQKQGGFYLDAIRNMQNTTLVHWSSAARGYTLNRVVRRIMAHNLAIQEPGEFRRRQGEAVRLNDGWIEQFPRNAVSYLLERTFHRYWMLHTTMEERELEDTLIREFRERLNQVKKEPDVQWDLPDMAVALQEEFTQDDEFPELLSDDAYRDLRQLADQFHEEMRVAWP